jgi:hypothetical protein
MGAIIMLQPYYENLLMSLLARAVDWKRRAIYNVGVIYSNIFSTNPSNKAQRIEITTEGIFIYDPNNNLVAKFDISNTILSLDGMNLQINNAPIAITTETLTDYIVIKDSGGNDVKVGIVT